MKQKLIIGALILVATATTAACGAMYWLLRVTDRMAEGQNTIVRVLESKIQKSGQGMSMTSFKTHLTALYPDERIVETPDAIEVCGARFLFQEGKYYGSQPIP